MFVKAQSLFILICFFTFSLALGENFHEELNWHSTNSPKGISTSNLNMDDFDGSIRLEAFHNLPLFSKAYPIHRTGELNVQLINEIYQSVWIEDKINEALILNEIQIISDIALDKGRPFARVTILPFRRTATGTIEKLISFDLQIDTKSNVNWVSGQREYADESILRSGTWHKMKIQKDGVFQITPNWLSDNGIGNNININNLRIFGNGGKRLSETAGDNPLDDLQEVPLRVFDQNGNGVFDATDYALFYAQGVQPVLYNEVTNRLYHDTNIYGFDSYYFISVDLSGNGKRMTTLNSSSATPTFEVNSFHDYWFHENEWVNLLRTGQRWYGEDFHNTPTRSFGFNKNHVVSGSTAVLTSAAAVNASRNSGNSLFNFDVNGNRIHTTTHQAINTTSLSFRYAHRQELSTEFILNSGNINIDVNFSKSISTALGWMDFMAVQLERELVFSDDFMTIQNLTSHGTGSVTAFNFSGSTSTHELWDITNRSEAKVLSIQNNRFVIPSEELNRFVAFRSNQQFALPTYVQAIENQNLHALGQRDAIIITDKRWMDAANSLGEFHLSEEGYTYHVADIEHVANEFASGQMDISGVRDFIKMFYDRANGVESLLPKYVVIFGDGTFDFRSIMVDEASNTNFIPLFTTLNAEHSGNSYPSDDFYGLLDDGEGQVASGALDVGVGRIPCKNSEEANRFVDKVKYYYSSPSLGPWRNMISLIADDEDTNTHLIDGENHTNTIEQITNDYNLEKIYFDSYRQESTPGGDRYPDVNRAIINRANSGAIFMNYIGHGGEGGWAHERVLDQQTINNINNLDNMPVWVTATCSFGKMDDPDIISGGESLVLNAAGGAVTTVTTTRLVNSSSNERINRNFLSEAFRNEQNALGEIFRLAKNLTGLNGNSNKFALLGDPMLTLAFPKYDVLATTLNGQPITNADTISALERVTIGGEVHDMNGQIMTNFNGIVFPTLYDKRSIINTLGNDPGSPVTDFEIQNNILFRGRASVVNGVFEFEFVVPRDITYTVGPGKLSLYAHNFVEDANGFDSRILIGGTSSDIVEDNVGPEITIYLDTENFVTGDETGTDPLLIANLFDESGINTTGNGLGHDITLVLDDNSQNTIVLNEFYEGELDNFQKGNLNYLISQLEPGLHTLTLKAWDVYNNSSEARLDFIVTDDQDIKLTHVLNYPNPFTTHTSFQFEHNVPGESLDVSVEIFTVSGRLIKTIRKEVLTNSSRVADIDWDGKDDYGDSIGKGVYVYKLKVRTASNISAFQFEKLVILK